MDKEDTKIVQDAITTLELLVDGGMLKDPETGTAGWLQYQVNTVKEDLKKLLLEKDRYQLIQYKEATTAYCENCGILLKPAAKFCGKCGTEV